MSVLPSQTLFSHPGDYDIPGYQILLLRTNERKPPPRSLVHACRKLLGTIRHIEGIMNKQVCYEEIM